MRDKLDSKKAVAKKNGRPLKVIDEKLVFELAKIHCTKEEIASIVGCSRDTLYERFPDILRQGFDVGKSSLRRLQWQKAEKGDTQMLIWLGKQWLGQRDKQPDEAQNIVFNLTVKEVP